MTGYTRKDVSNNIANGNVVNADDLDLEFDGVVAAFDNVTGHSHDGSGAEGAPITVVGPAQDVVVSDTAVTPKTDDIYDLGSATNEWKDLYVDGTANIDTLAADVATVGGVEVATTTGTQTLTGKTIDLTSNTLVATSAQLLAAITDETGTGSVVFSTAPTISDAILTGVPTATTAAADTNTTQVATTAHVFAERSNTATLTNKTLTSPTISGGSISGITDLAIADGGTGASTSAGALSNLGLTATAAQINSIQQLAGRNLIINGSGRINQRGYVSGTATSGANQYTLDRWRVVVSGQNLSFTGNGAGRIMTAPAGGVEQVVESLNVIGGIYVLNWTGTATATVNGIPRAKGEAFTLSNDITAIVRMIGGTFTDVQLELGSVPTSFDRAPFSDELALCQRYYESGGGAAFGAGQMANIGFSVQKRTTPSILTTATGGTFTTGPIAGPSGFYAVYSVTVAFDWAASAEL